MAPRSFQSRLLDLPLELRLIIYEYILFVPNEFWDRRFIVVRHHTNEYTTSTKQRGQLLTRRRGGNYQSLSCLLTVNRQISQEVEPYLYSKCTLFFSHSFAPLRASEFVDSMSDTARWGIQSVGFEIVFHVHSPPRGPKHRLQDYRDAAEMLASRLPNWKRVVIYLDPEGLYPTYGEGTTHHGVQKILRDFQTLRKEVSISPPELSATA